MSIRVLLVHYHTPVLARRAVAALSSGPVARPDVLIVDNGSTPDEAAILADLGVEILAGEGNLGYAGALNLGVRRSSPQTQAFLALNPDVEMTPVDLGALHEALGEADAAGPRFWWDPQRTALLPPTERRRALDELLGALARRRGPARRIARRRWRRHALAHHRAEQPLVSWSLSGAALAFRRSAWETTGGFDEGFRLYFEESDWLLRLRRAGGTAVHLPAASAIHKWGASSRSEPAAAGWFADSCRRFRERHYGRLTRRLLERLERRLPDPEPDFGPGACRGAAWLEIAASPTGFPAAMVPQDPAAPLQVEIPATLLETIPPGRFWLRAVTPGGREIAARASAPQAGLPPL